MGVMQREIQNSQRQVFYQQDRLGHTSSRELTAFSVNSPPISGPIELDVAMTIPMMP